MDDATDAKRLLAKLTVESLTHPGPEPVSIIAPLNNIAVAVVWDFFVIHNECNTNFTVYSCS